MQKKCHCCHKLKFFTEFNKCKANKDGLQFVCKTCKKEWFQKRYKIKRKEIIAQTIKWRNKHKEQWLKYSDEYRNKNRIRIRIRKVLSLYNLTLEDYNRIFLSQNKKCAICGIENFAPKIDHDHKTGKVRGILCFNCNTGLGNFKDNIDYLNKAISDLKETT